MGVADIKSALAHLPGIEGLTITPAGDKHLVALGARTAVVSQNAAPSEIEAALSGLTIPNPFTARQSLMPTIGEQLKAARAQIADARKAASEATADMADATRVVLQEVDKAKKEAADLRAEVAELTNGGPT